jgi:hypothetical protein
VRNISWKALWLLADNRPPSRQTIINAENRPVSCIREAVSSLQMAGWNIVFDPGLQSSKDEIERTTYD